MLDKFGPSWFDSFVIGQDLLDRAMTERTTRHPLPPADSAYRPFPKPETAEVSLEPLPRDPYREAEANVVTVVLGAAPIKPRVVAISIACVAAALVIAIQAVGTGAYGNLLLALLVGALGIAPWIVRARRRQCISVDRDALRVSGRGAFTTSLDQLAALESVEQRTRVDVPLFGVTVDRRLDRSYELRARLHDGRTRSIAHMISLEECWWLEDTLRSSGRLP